jgi:hypothetical protein
LFSILSLRGAAGDVAIPIYEIATGLGDPFAMAVPARFNQKSTGLPGNIIYLSFQMS